MPDGSSKIRVKNPATLYIQPTQTGQLTVQLFPLLFGELISAKVREAGTYWDYDAAGIALGVDIELDEKLVDQYTKIFNPSKIITPANAGNKVIQLFDEE